MTSTRTKMNRDYPKMDPEWKAIWLAALRSDEYEQGRNTMCSTRDDDEQGDAFCCLGVAGDELVQHGLARWTHAYGPNLVLVASRDLGVEGKNNNAASGGLPRALRRFIGLDDSASLVLIEMNDELNLDFKRIANWIERKL